MIFNFTKKHQFTTNLRVNGSPIETVSETKLLGTYITSDLKWNKNTSELVKKAFQRMQLLYRSANFTSNRQDLRKIYLTFIRSVLENSAVVWHSGLSIKNRLALERVQKAAVRLMMGGKYVDYKHGSTFLNIDDLNTRRKNLCLKFAKNCLKNKKVENMFPKNVTNHKMKKRKTEKFKKKLIKRSRFKKSAIPYMVDLLNKDAQEKKNILNNGP